MPGKFHRDGEASAATNKQDWGTPQRLFDHLNGLFGFTVDGCAHAGNNKLPRYWTEEQDCFNQSWKGEKIWFNPPFDEKERWHKEIVKRLREEREISYPMNAPDVFMLIPLDTSTRLWQEIISSPWVHVIYAIKGKIRFVESRGSDGRE